MDVAATLRDARERADLTQAELARRAGIPATVLSAYENGRREPGAMVYLRVLQAAGFETVLFRLPDPVECARQLADVMSLADAMPFEPKPLAFANVTWH